MVVEYIRYNVPAEKAEAFHAAYKQASAVLDNSPYCTAYELARGVEEPAHWTVRIEWTSREDHEKAFRTSPEFAIFFQAVKPFFENIEEMKHYEISDVAARK